MRGGNYPHSSRRTDPHNLPAPVRVGKDEPEMKAKWGVEMALVDTCLPGRVARGRAGGRGHAPSIWAAWGEATGRGAPAIK
jgi:hypothetical protein